MKIVFIDRDGVINRYPGPRKYVTDVKDFEFVPGSIEGIRKLKEKGFKVFVVSNQAGVSKGLYTEDDLDQMNKKLLLALKKRKASVEGIYYCTHKDDDNCSCRKPKTGLLEKIVEDFSLRANQMFFIGDSFRDMKTGKEFGAKTILVLSGQEKIANRSGWEFEPDYIFDNLLLAAHYLCSHNG